MTGMMTFTIGPARTKTQAIHTRKSSRGKTGSNIVMSLARVASRFGVTTVTDGEVAMILGAEGGGVELF